MADISIHNVQNIEFEKYPLDSGTLVYKIKINCKTELSKQEYNEEITLFIDNKEVYKNLKI